MLVAVGCFLLAVWLRRRDDVTTLPSGLIEGYAVCIGSLLPLWVLISWRMRFYRSHRTDPPYVEAAELLVLTTTSTGIAFLVSSMVRPITLDHARVIGVFWGLLNGVLITLRLAARLFLTWLRGLGHNLRNYVIVGTNRRGLHLERSIHARPSFGLRLLGFVDDRFHEPATQAAAPLLGKVEDIESVLDREPVDLVFIVLTMKSHYEQIGAIARTCARRGVEFRVLADLFDLNLSGMRTGSIGDVSYFRFHRAIDSPLQLSLKRAFDVAVSALLLAILWPVLLVLCLLVKLTSPGPVFFTQERIGLNFRRFKVLKLRTMVDGADRHKPVLQDLNEMGGPVFKIRKDPRLTPVGAFLRRFSLDELPQLVNILRGEMSFVGPRPLPNAPHEFDAETKRRHSVRPGLTCLWQVRGRNQIGFDHWMQMDLEYIDNWSLWLDLRILFATIGVVVRGNGY